MSTPSQFDEIESALKSLAPVTSQLDRDATLHAAAYAAGRADAMRRPALRAWRAATCVATAACLVLLVDRRVGSDAVEVAPATNVAELRPPAATDRPSWSLNGPLAIRPADITVADAPETLPKQGGAATRSRTAGGLLDELLDELQNRPVRRSEA